MPNPKLAAIAAVLVVSILVLLIDNDEREHAIKDERLHVIEWLSATRAKLEAAINMPVSVTRALAVVYAAHSDLPEDEFIVLAAAGQIIRPGVIRHRFF